MNFLITDKCGNTHFVAVVPTENHPYPSPSVQKGQMKPQVKGMGSEGGLRSKWGILEEDRLPEQLGSLA